MGYDRLFLLLGLLYALTGMGLGIRMAATEDHSMHVVHAHILLVGFLLSLVYALIHKLWLAPDGGWLARLQFWLHNVAAIALLPALALLYAGRVAPETLEPILSAGSMGIFAGMALMVVLVWKDRRHSSRQ